MLLEGRINRIGQKRLEIDYNIVTTGLLTHIHHNHQLAKNLSDTLKELADEIIL